MFLQDVLHAHHVDFFRLNELSVEGFKAATARGAGLISLVEVMLDVLNGELRLRCRAVALLGALRLLGLVVSRAALAAAEASLLVALRQLLLELGDLRFDFFRRCALERRVFAA